MPHLLFMMLGLIIFMSCMTYILPAGEYVEINGIQQYQPVDRTPVSLIAALMLIVDGIVNASTVIAAINFVVPSASAKAAALISIIKPMAETLSISPQLAVQAFQVGDGMMNILSPFNGVTLAGIALARVSFGKWAKWVIPLVIIYYIVQFILLFILGTVGWA